MFNLKVVLFSVSALICSSKKVENCTNFEQNLGEWITEEKDD